jgi:hypothetical protein
LRRDAAFIALWNLRRRTPFFYGENRRREMVMPAKSKAQQKAAGAALAAKRGDEKVGDLQGASKSMYTSMDEGELEALASTKLKGKPEHVADKK